MEFERSYVSMRSLKGLCKVSIRVGRKAEGLLPIPQNDSP